MKYMLNASRRKFLKISLAVMAGPSFMSCVASSVKRAPVEPRLTARPSGIPVQTINKGLSRLDPGSKRGGIVYVPESYSPDIAMPLFIAMHGSGEGSSIWKSYYARAEERGMVLLAPESQGTTWDLIKGDYGADLVFLDRALKYVFAGCNIDPGRIALCGFSDGATYALSLGVSNGDLFSHLIGYSPGFISGREPIVGRPRIYISHGTKDRIFPVRVTRDNIVPAFKKSGYNVVYNEFEGGHEVPAAVTDAALEWFLDGI